MRSRGRSTAVDRERLKEELRERYQWLQALSDHELREVSFCLMAPKGQLKEGEKYFDVSHPERGIIVGRAGEVVPEGSCYVPRGEVPQDVWNRIIRAAEEAGLTR